LEREKIKEREREREREREAKVEPEEGIADARVLLSLPFLLFFFFHEYSP